MREFAREVIGPAERALELLSDPGDGSGPDSVLREVMEKYSDLRLRAPRCRSSEATG